MKVNFHCTTFGPRFEEECKNNNIPLYVLPPRSPKYNGRVERANGIMREELIDNKELFKNIDTIGEFNLLLEEFNRNYNCYRPHSSIDYLTPMEYYEKCKKNEVSFSQMY